MVSTQTRHKGKRDRQGQGGAGSTDLNVLESLLGGVKQALFFLGSV